MGGILIAPKMYIVTIENANSLLYILVKNN